MSLDHERLGDCPVCGRRDYGFNPVIWPELASEWRLAPDELEYVDRQQGGHCRACGANFRSLALALAIKRHLGADGTLTNHLRSTGRELKVLEINEAGNLSALLRETTDWTLASYPEVDVHSLPYEEGSFDLVVHSDTLEHVAQPVHGLQECRRVLKTDGACCYTVPIIIARLSSSRAGLAPSYHGAPGTNRDDFVVVTEFGADAWTYPIRGGFSRVSISTFDYPSAIALACGA